MLWIGQVESLLALESTVFYASHSNPGSLVKIFGVGIVHVDQKGLEEEKDSVREEETAAAGQDYQVYNILWSLVVSSQVKGAQLGDEELQIVSDLRGKVGIDPHFLQWLNGVGVMGIE